MRNVLGATSCVLLFVAPTSNAFELRTHSRITEAAIQQSEQVGTVVDGSFAGDVAEYLIVQDAHGDRQGFFINLIREGDGMWRISRL